LESFEKGNLVNTQEAIEEYLGTDFNMFTSSIMMGQNRVQNFVAEGEQLRMQIIEHSLGLERIHDYFEHAKKQRITLAEKISQLVLKEKHLETLIQDWKKNGDQFKQ